jgi:hypothetical protein
LCLLNVKIRDINDQINIVSVFIGLILSIFILFGAAVYFYFVVTSGLYNITLYFGIILLLMAFFGSLVAGMLGNHNLLEGSVNGAFLSLIIVVLICFIVGVLFFVLMGVAGMFNSALTSTFHATTTTSTSNSGPNYFTIQNAVEFILFVIMFFVLGMLGGAFGVFLKNGIRETIKRIKQ